MAVISNQRRIKVREAVGAEAPLASGRQDVRAGVLGGNPEIGGTPELWKTGKPATVHAGGTPAPVQGQVTALKGPSVSVIRVADNVHKNRAGAQGRVGTHLNSYLDSDFSSQAVFPPPKFFLAVSAIPCRERVDTGLALLPRPAGGTLVHYGGDPVHRRG